MLDGARHSQSLSRLGVVFVCARPHRFKRLSGYFHRRGIGRIRHLHTPLLWVQQKRANKEIEVRKTPGLTNPSDLGTNELTRPEMIKHLTRCSFALVGGAHPKALKAQFMEGPTATS